jgi:putative salt-induced outer membrane protein YdiY
MLQPSCRALKLLCAALALSLSCTAAGAREKIDAIVLRNGDRITGEIKTLEHGHLSVDTDYMSIVLIEWLDVVEVHTTQGFVIEDVHGDVYYGAIDSDSGRGAIAVATGDGTSRRLELAEIARISPEEKTFVNRLDGSLSVGFDYAKSSDITTLGASLDTTYRGRSIVWNFSADVNSTKDPTQGTLDRDTVVFVYRWLREHGQFWSGLSSFERNEETGVEARVTVGGGFGKYLMQTSRSELSMLIGVGATQEWATGEDDSQSSLEGIIAADWRIFQFSTPKVTLAASGVLYPSITESGRYRTNLSMSLRREIITDFYLDLSLYGSYDNQPPDSEAEKSDYGLTTSLGYSF